MIDKIKNNIINDSHIEYIKGGVNYSQQMPVNVETRANNNTKVDIEEFNFDSTDKDYSGNVITESMVMEAMKENLVRNREFTNQMNNDVYEGIKNKIDQYVSNSGAGNK